MGNFYWDSHTKISEYALEEIVEEGENLGVQTQQMKKIYKKAQDYDHIEEDNSENIPVDGDLEAGSRVFMMKCASCHLL